jgi:leader peptidase (prepilin peptidase)/N-methyltransferase
MNFIFYVISGRTVTRKCLVKYIAILAPDFFPVDYSIRNMQNLYLVEIVLLVIFFLFGAALGSFLNVCIDRLPVRESIISGPSHCDGCQRRLSPLEMVPIVSFLALRGRCRSCGSAIPRRVLWVEVITAVLVAFLYWRFGLSVQLPVMIFYCCLFLVIAFIDLKHTLILNSLVFPSLLIAGLIDIFIPSTAISGSLWGNASLLNGIIHTGALLNGVIGGVTGFVLLLIIALVFRGGMGWGDVKMAALIGMATGFPLVLVSLIMAVILGGLIAIILLVFRIKKRKDAIPFGPFLSLATVATLLWGQFILNWYVGLFRF